MNKLLRNYNYVMASERYLLYYNEEIDQFAITNGEVVKYITLETLGDMLFTE